RTSIVPTGADPALLGALAQMFLGLLGVPSGGVSLLCGPAHHGAVGAFSMLPLAAGGSVVMRHKFDPAETLELIDRHGVTNLHLVPTQFIRLLPLPDHVRRRVRGDALGTPVR